MVIERIWLSYKALKLTVNFSSSISFYSMCKGYQNALFPPDIVKLTTYYFICLLVALRHSTLKIFSEFLIFSDSLIPNYLLVLISRFVWFTIFISLATFNSWIWTSHSPSHLLECSTSGAISKSESKPYCTLTSQWSASMTLAFSHLIIMKKITEKLLCLLYRSKIWDSRDLFNIQNHIINLYQIPKLA